MKEVLIIVAEMSVCGTVTYLLYLLTVHSFGRRLSSAGRFAFLKSAALLFVLPVSKALSPLLSMTEMFTTAAAEPAAPSGPGITPPQITMPNIPVQDFVTPAVPMAPVDPNVSAAAEAAAKGIDVLTVLAVIWITGVAAIYIWRIICRLRFEHEIRCVLVPAGEEILSVYLRCCESMGVTRGIPVYICEKVYTPMIVGAVRPKIILPQKEISKKSLEFVFRHELTHYQRGDIFFKIFVSIVTALHWFNPLVYVFNRELTLRLELSCDERVGRTLDCDGRKDYCMAILETVPVKRTADAGLIFGTSGKKKLKQRLDNMLNLKKMGLRQKIIAAGAAVVIIGVSCVLVAMVIPADRSVENDLHTNDHPNENGILDASNDSDSREDNADDDKGGTDDAIPDKADDNQLQDAIDDQPEDLPEGYAFHQLTLKTGHLYDTGGVGSIDGVEDPQALVNFILPEDWIFNGSSVAHVGDTKVFEIGAIFPTEEFNLEKVSRLGADATFPAVIVNNAGHDVTVYEQEISDSGLYDYMSHGSALLYTGEYETYTYIVSRNGWAIHVIFVVNENFDEAIVENVLNSVNIMTVP